MAKRFLDTGFLSQKWIRKLKPEEKCFLIYIMLECDNAGIIDIDFEDVEFWIGKKIDQTLSFLPKSYVIFMKDSGKYFIPKFIEYQYPDLSSNKNIVVQARRILNKYGLLDENNEISINNFMLKLPKSQVTSNSNSIGNSKGILKEEKKKKSLFKNSGITIEDIDKAFKKTDDLINADSKHYFNRLFDASESKGLIYTDWIATARSWARRDLNEDKLVIKKSPGKSKIEF